MSYEKPYEGLKVIDFSQGVAGPQGVQGPTGPQGPGGTGGGQGEGTCVYSGKPATQIALFAKAY